MSNGQVCVVGAGIIGLSTAVEVQRQLPHVKMVLMADKFSPHLTSDVAAGIWRTTDISAQPDCERKVAWAADTMHVLRRLAKDDAQRYGASMVSGYELGDAHKPGWRTNMEPYVSDYVELSARDRSAVCDDERMTHGVHYTTTFLEPKTYLPHLMKEFVANGGEVQQGKVADIRALSAQYSTVVNCTGLGSYGAAADTSMYPIRGQVFRIAAPFLKHHYAFALDGKRHYALVNQECCIIGGVHDQGDWNEEWDDAVGDWIWDGITGYLPAIRYSPIISRHTGLRPGRATVRLETERLPNGRSIVHNYGHGSYGVTLHHGCAVEAARLVVDDVHKARL